MTLRRMISRELMFSDLFLGFDAMSTVLYYSMILHADDDGFVDVMTTIMRTIGATKINLEPLLKTGAVIDFRSGVCLIAHWLYHNTPNRPGYKPTKHIMELAQVYLDEDTWVYMRK